MKVVYRKMFLLLFQESLSFRKCQKEFNFINIILVQNFCPLNTEITCSISYQISSELNKTVSRISQSF